MRIASQSPFSSGEVFHLDANDGNGTILIVRWESQSPFSSGEVFHMKALVNLSGGTSTSLCLNPLLVAGKYSTAVFSIT